MHPVPPIVVLDYRVRLPGMLFIAVFAVAHFGGRRQSPLLVAAMVLTALWPHAAYLLAKNAKDTKQAELRNLLFDSFIVGCWMVAMSFSLWPPGARAATIMNGNLSVGGLRFAGKGVLAILAGVLVTGAFLGFHPVFASNVATTALCIAATLILTSMFGIHSHLQTARVYKAKNDLAIQNQQIQEQNRLIEHARQTALEARDAAESDNRAKSAFLANMSHELRTPLNAIIGYSEMLEEETHELGKVDNVKDLQKIQCAGKHLLSLINDVLDLSKIEAGRMGLHLEAFDIAQMIEEMVSTLHPAISKNSNTIRVHLAEDLGAMRADITKVRQILFNLLSNASKFTERGKIILEVRREEEQPTADIVFCV